MSANNEQHPREVFRHCPRCGAAGFEPQRDNSFRCGPCGFVFYFNAAPAVAALIAHDDGRLLLARRGSEPKKGMLDLPGGFVNPLEIAEDAVLREVREELGIELAEIAYFASCPNTYPWGGLLYTTLDLAFLCHAESFETLKAGDDVSDFVFMQPADIDLQEIAFNSARYFIERYRG